MNLWWTIIVGLICGSIHGEAGKDKTIKGKSSPLFSPYSKQSPPLDPDNRITLHYDISSTLSLSRVPQNSLKASSTPYEMSGVSAHTSQIESPEVFSQEKYPKKDYFVLTEDSLLLLVHNFNFYLEYLQTSYSPHFISHFFNNLHSNSKSKATSQDVEKFKKPYREICQVSGRTPSYAAEKKTIYAPIYQVPGPDNNSPSPFTAHSINDILGKSSIKPPD